MTTPAWSFESPVEYYIAKNSNYQGTLLRDGAVLQTPRAGQSTTRLPSSGGQGSLARNPTMGRSPRPSPKPSPITPTAPSFTSERRKNGSKFHSQASAARTLAPPLGNSGTGIVPFTALRRRTSAHAGPLGSLDGAGSFGEENAAALTPDNKSMAKLHVKHDPSPERRLANRWLKGKIGLSLRGTGGKDGGELRIINVVPPVKPGDKPVRRRCIFAHAVTMEDSWTIPDVQHLHPSVSQRSFGLSLKLREMVEEVDAASSSRSQTPPVPPVPALPPLLSPKAAYAPVAEEDVFAIIASGPPKTPTDADPGPPGAEIYDRSVRTVTDPGSSAPTSNSLGKDLLQSGKKFLRRRQASETGKWGFGRSRAKTLSKVPAPAPQSFDEEDDEVGLLRPAEDVERERRAAARLSPMTPYSAPKSPSRSSLMGSMMASASAASFVNTIDSSASESEQVNVTEVEVSIFLSFASAQERDEWFTILRSLAQVDSSVDGRIVRPHRRLKVNVLDVTEIAQPLSVAAPSGDRRTPNGSGVETDEKSSHLSVSGSDVMSSSGSPGRTIRSTGKDYEQTKKVKAGWSWKEKLRVELVLDDKLLIARTAWTRAENPNGTAFWGEQFSLTEMPNFTKCNLLIYRAKDKDKEKTPVLFGQVDLPLVSSFGRSEDERYPVRSLGGMLIGEIRLTVSFQEVDILPLAEYNSMWTHGDELLTTPQQIMNQAAGPKMLYVLGGRGLMEGTMEYLARIALVEKVLMPRVIDTCTLEAKAAGSTLFRSTTPLSKTLEVLMRMMCGEFLQAAIGPTIRRTIEEKIEPKLFCNYGDPEHPPLNYRILKDVTSLVEQCWANMYAHRGLFPNFIRHILGHLFVTVREFHDDGDDLLRYKAVSSFVFLRLIGPALMSPHLFGLADCLLPSAQQRTLTLIAKILHTLAFFSDRDLARHPDLALFRGFIRRNTHAMLDFLTAIATPVGEIEDLFPEPTRLDDYLEERRTVLTEWEGQALPHMTFAGCIDLPADWAVMLEIWAENLARPGIKLNVVGCRVDDIQDMLDKYAGYVQRIHALAFPEGRGALSSGSTRSLTSLSAKSEDSLPMLPRKWLGYTPEDEKRISRGLSIESVSASPSSSRPTSTHTHTRSVSRAGSPDGSAREASRAPSPEEEERIRVTLRPASAFMLERDRAPSPAGERVGVERSLEPPSNIVLTSPHETTILLSGSPSPPVPPKLFPPPMPLKAKLAQRTSSLPERPYERPPSLPPKPRSPTRPIPALPDSPRMPIPLPEDVAGPNVVSPTTATMPRSPSDEGYGQSAVSPTLDGFSPLASPTLSPRSPQSPRSRPLSPREPQLPDTPHPRRKRRPTLPILMLGGRGAANAFDEAPPLPPMPSMHPIGGPVPPRRK